MTAVKKMTVKILSEEFCKLKENVLKLEDALEKSNDDKKEQLKVIKSLEQKVEHLQREVEKGASESKSDDVESIPSTNLFKCRKCNVDFKNKSDMKNHMKEQHPNKTKCNHCDKIYNLNIDLEVHMKTHEKQKQYKCDKCEHRFYLKWRLRKHMEGHDGKILKYCHYFNNALTCPFEENGCMFLHKMSPFCRFNATCANKLCQFRHSNKSKNINTREVEKDKHSDNWDNSDEVNTEEINDSELEDDDDEETEIIYQRFLENHKKKENENRKKSNEENVTAQMQKFKFVST